MKILLNLIQKEFIQIFRNRVMLPVIFVAPILQMVILVFAANLEMKEIKFAVTDQDLSSTSIRLVSEFKASPYYHFVSQSFNLQESEDLLAMDHADLIIHIPPGFEENLRRENRGELQLLINAVNATKAGLINAYSGAIIQAFNQDIRSEWLGVSTNGAMKQISLKTDFWYNPLLNYKIYMLPGIVVILVTLIGMFLTALNLVREKELGTTEQINVTPIRKTHFLAGKLIPFLLIALLELTISLAIGNIFFKLPMEGSLLLLFAFAIVYLIAVLGIGLFLSTISSNQQQVMFLSFFFMLTFILMSGIFTPVESMPDWAQFVNIINPFAYFMKVIRMILLKGSGFEAIQFEFLAMGVYAILMMALSIYTYRKVS